MGFGIWYALTYNFWLVGYNSDGDGFLADRKNSSIYFFDLGSCVVSWCSKKQPTTEYIAAALATCEAIWLKIILIDLKQEEQYATIIYCDNMSTISMSKNPMFNFYFCNI